MQFAKKMTALLLCFAMAFVATACSTQKTAENAADDGAEGGLSAIDRDAIAVKVGEDTITAGEVEDAYKDYMDMMSYYGYPAPTSDTDIETLQDTVLASRIEALVLKAKAKEYGCDVLTEEEQARYDEELAKETEELLSYYMEEGADVNDEAARAQAIEKINSDLEQYGMGMDFEEYTDSMKDYVLGTITNEKLEKKIKDTVTAAEQDARDYYDKLLADQKTTMEDPVNYLRGEMDYEMDLGDPMLVVPENYARIRALVISPEGALDEGYQKLIAEMEEMEAEYGKMLLSGNMDAARKEEIEKTYAEEKSSTDQMMEEFLSTARQTAEEAQKELQSGTAFADVFAKYNTDDTYTNYPAIAEKGKLILLTEEDGEWSEEIREAVKTLEDGQYTDVIQVDNDFYIVCRIGNEPSGEIAYEDIKDVMTDLAAKELQDEAWEKQKAEWVADDSLVIRYPETYRAVGKQ